MRASITCRLSYHVQPPQTTAACNTPANGTHRPKRPLGPICTSTNGESAPQRVPTEGPGKSYIRSFRMEVNAYLRRVSGPVPVRISGSCVTMTRSILRHPICKEAFGFFSGLPASSPELTWACRCGMDLPADGSVDSDHSVKGLDNNWV